MANLQALEHIFSHDMAFAASPSTMGELEWVLNSLRPLQLSANLLDTHDLEKHLIRVLASLLILDSGVELSLIQEESLLFL